MNDKTADQMGKVSESIDEGIALKQFLASAAVVLAVERGRSQSLTHESQDGI